MPERPGDKPINERVNEGEVDLSHFYSDNLERDAYLVITGHKRNRQLTPGEKYASTRKDSVYSGGFSLPDFVVNSLIYVEDRDGDGNSIVRNWNYVYEAGVNSVRRVFLEINQALELDVRESLIWLSKSEDVQTLALLKQENEDSNNQYIMQLMYDRIQQGLPMLFYRYSSRKI